jgi:hypothetical protein
MGRKGEKTKRIDIFINSKNHLIFYLRLKVSGKRAPPFFAQMLQKTHTAHGKTEQTREIKANLIE